MALMARMKGKKSLSTQSSLDDVSEQIIRFAQMRLDRSHCLSFAT